MVVLWNLLKMDFYKSLLLCVLCVSTFGSTNSQKTVCKKVADIVFLVDGSWSIGRQNFKVMQDFLYTMISGFDIGQDKIRVGLIQYTDTPRTEFFLNTYDSKMDILKFIRTLKYKGGSTKTGQSLQFMLENHFTEQAGSRSGDGVPQIAVLITDGQAQDNIREPAAEVKNAGITLYAIGIKDAVLSELIEMASEPVEKHVYNVVDFSALKGISQNMLQVICTTVEEARRQTSQIATACRKATVADIVFVVDSSTSIGQENFQKVKSFLYTLVSSLDIGNDRIRIGLAQYSDQSYPEFMLNEYTSKSEILERIQNLPYRTGGSNTGEALDFIGNMYFTESDGSRAKMNIPQITVVLTDGESTDDVKEPAKKLKSRGISIYVIGIGIKDAVKLQEAASKPAAKFQFDLASFDALENFLGTFLHNICFSVETQIEALSTLYADVVFLVDSSEKMGADNFQKIKTLLSNTIRQLDVGANKYQIGVAQYSGTPQTEFLLNAYQTTEGVLDHIQKRLVFRGGPLKTGNALAFLRTTFFTEGAGSRMNQGIPQYAVLITAGKSEDDVRASSQELQDLGVTVVSVGVQGSALEELETIANPPNVFQVQAVQDFDQLQQELLEVLPSHIEQQIDQLEFTDALESGGIPFLPRSPGGPQAGPPAKRKERLQAKAPAVCGSASVADIVFLIDESTSIGTQNFQLTKAFLYKVINALDIGQSTVRVGMVLYSDVPRLEFTLDTFNEKYEILDYIKKLPYRQGETYTGAAIDFLRTHVFVESKGSRRDEGVQQIAVVMTNGGSMDNFTRPASELRRAGVEVFAVGFQDATEKELASIASYPPRKHVTNVESFLQLSNIEWKLKKRLCNEIVTQAFVEPLFARTLKDGCVDTEEADIYFLVDGSGSIFPQDFQDMKTFMNELVTVFNVGAKQVRFGVVQYSDDPQVEFTISEYTTQASVKKAIQTVRQLGGGTNTGAALMYMKSLFVKAADDRPKKVPQSLVVITDGASQDRVTEAAKELRADGITIYAIGVKSAIKEQLLDISGTDERTFFVNNFDSLNLIKHELVREICSTEACKNLKADVLFLVDGSASINPDDFTKMKDFMEIMVRQSDVGPDKVHFGLIQFSSRQQEEFPLNKYSRKADITAAIFRSQQLQEGTMTGAALTFALPYFGTHKGGRPSVKQYLIVITDGEAQDVVAGPAKALRDRGITIYAIGVLQANNSQLVEIAGSQEKALLEETFDTLSFLPKDILFQICNPDEICKRTEVADIMFLVDGSTSIKLGEFKIMQRFMEALVNDSTVGKDQVQFGAVIYSTNPHGQFNLSTYSTKGEVLKGINSMKRITGFTYTATALSYTQERFGILYGGRPPVTKILVLITDGETTKEDRGKLPAASTALKDSGIVVFAVGVGKAKVEELKLIAGQDDRAFMVMDYSGLEHLHENITHIVCTNSKPACSHEQVDVVFLIDGSGSITATNFTAMKIFMKDIVGSFTIAPNRVRIGVAQYSHKPQKEFFLDEYSTSSEIDQRIDAIAQLKRTTFTGKALDFVRQFFDPAHGSRKNQGVPQYLVVITDGNSNDTVAAEAAALRSQGVYIFSIGIGLLNSFELVQIAGTPKNVYTVENFGMLETITRRVVAQICEPADPPSQECSIEVTVGIDFSWRATPSLALRVQQKLQLRIPEVLLRMSNLGNISCSAGSPISIRFKYIVPSPGGGDVFDSAFEKYDEEIIRKFLTAQSKEDTYLNKEFLMSIWKKMSTGNSATKVLLVFTDGIDDSPETLKETVETLRAQGLKALLMVGLESSQDLKMIQELQFGRGIRYKDALAIGQQDLPGLLQRDVDTVAERECCNVVCKCHGQKGVPGPTGGSGIKGQPGPKGSPGHPGEEGGHGERGQRGLNGTRGEDGCPGIRGQKGVRGFRGDTGEDGHNGLDGVNGEQGDRGSPGTSGEPGSSGSQGRKGPRGQPGERGDLGLRGDSGDTGTDNDVEGPKGQKGNAGRQGEPGIDGVQGENGDEGLDGPVGRRGPQGLKGARGILGEAGKPGDAGIQGIQGSRGLPGPKGPPGLQGLHGPQGGLGFSGVPGSAGNPGPKGQKGEPGDLGENGSPGPEGRRGMPGVDGNDGYGEPGRKGDKGQEGFPGYPGLQGDDGEVGSNGGIGAKGLRGRRGDTGSSGHGGDPGEKGPPGRRGAKGTQGTVAMTPCQLIEFSRGNCRPSKCPVYPTEVVFALDTSKDVTAAAFQRMKGIVLKYLEGMDISESNCPSGARVSVVSYGANTKYLIRFSDYKRKSQLLDAVKRISPERSSAVRSIGAAMQYVARNVFKRVRQGILMRKVAIFFTNGPSQDATAINTAVLEMSALDIVPVVIAFEEVPNVLKASEVDDTKRSKVFVWKKPEDERLGIISECALCYDKCQPDVECELSDPPPVEVDMDIAFIIDGSRTVSSEDFDRVKDFVSTMVDYIEITSQPESDSAARVAVVQQTMPGFAPNRDTSPVKVEYDFVTHKNKNTMKRHIQEVVSQLGGPSAIGHAVQWTIDNIFLKAPNLRRNKVIFTIIGSQTSNWDIEKLKEASRLAKCQGFIMFTLAFGSEISDSELGDLSSFPQDQHLVRLGQFLKPEMEYAHRFSRAFLNLLLGDLNTYPPPGVRGQCQGRGDARALNAELISVVERVPFPDYGGGFDAPEPTEDALEEELATTEEPAVEEPAGNQEEIEVPAQRPRGKATGRVSGNCLLEVDPGTGCKDFRRMWYYIQAVDACSQFWYGGCDGNGNRFSTERECLRACSSKRISDSDVEATLSEDACAVAKEEGGCQEYSIKWFFNEEDNTCNQFWYGGCGGNSNRFETQQACEAVCVKSS
ncbi:collagen alpha-4(VI) chain-like isoform X2 [Ambystoma mexicanum]|uniref:collagen alpha-4(VI) chain-like isoform X2 n=1 Tax=Ambystoma mexicanum TaxID=8296 RepID=UPI0037E93FD7